MSIKTKQNAASVKDFVMSVSDEQRRKDCRAVMKIMKSITGKSPKMWGTSIIGYDSYTYKNTTKIENQWPLTGLSPRKSALTIYIMPGFSKYQSLMKKLGTYKTGSSCLYIKNLDDIDLDILKKIIAKSVQDMKKMYP